MPWITLSSKKFFGSSRTNAIDSRTFTPRLLSDLNKDSDAVKDKSVEKNIQIPTFLK